MILILRQSLSLLITRKRRSWWRKAIYNQGSTTQQLAAAHNNASSKLLTLVSLSHWSHFQATRCGGVLIISNQQKNNQQSGPHDHRPDLNTRQHGALKMALQACLEIAALPQSHLNSLPVDLRLWCFIANKRCITFQKRMTSASGRRYQLDLRTIK